MTDLEECERLLNSLTIAKMVIWYNDMADQLGERRATKFENRSVAVARCKRLMALCGLLPKGSVCMEKKKRSIVFRYPPSDEIRTPGKGTQRACVVGMLKRGATLAEVAQFIRFRDLSRGKTPTNVETRAYRQIRELHLELGWGLREEDRPGVVGKVVFIFDNASVSAGSHHAA
jgi:hypothetical protein